jgi:hypothetical protein
MGDKAKGRTGEGGFLLGVKIFLIYGRGKRGRGKIVLDCIYNYGFTGSLLEELA